MKVLRYHRCLFMIVIGIFFLLLIGFLGYRSYYRSKYSLTCSSYCIQTDQINDAIRIVQISDLHNSLFGEKNEELVTLVSEQSPDLILLTGDLVNSDEACTDIALDLIAALAEIAPVYSSLGNHELEYQANYGTNLAELYEEAGAVVLERQYQDMMVKGQTIRLGGIYGYCLPAKYLETNEANPEECAFLADFQNTDWYTILMCHMPVCWMLSGGLDEWDVDCVFSGHAHGGQVILPWIGGVYAPDMGWFPGRLRGLYSSEDGSSVMVLSAGLGNTEKIPRLNNVPEVVSVDLVPRSLDADFK